MDHPGQAQRRRRHLTTWRILDGIVACCGAVLLVWSLIWDGRFTALGRVPRQP
jgi:hypothetical protein